MGAEGYWNRRGWVRSGVLGLGRRFEDLESMEVLVGGRPLLLELFQQLWWGGDFSMGDDLGGVFGIF